MKACEECMFFGGCRDTEFTGICRRFPPQVIVEPGYTPKSVFPSVGRGGEFKRTQNAKPNERN